ncbi:ABC transporter permease subunit [Iocasia frigidifontis]|uniref:ABC transporter permease subunit n=1 Tax=Iocasia fonsfrigidae TaxID=2682810 RepID=A0A8A7KPQ0_9FIRM|nr:carbohydrate ABC transporter permease [Iocasia fonsfrigidae]QTL99782.1 ABC transporter permease subunit [Iocasia fonsfrigidae]
MKNKGRSIQISLTHIIMILFLVMLLFPTAVMISTSFKTFDSVLTWPPTWISEDLQFVNYWTVWVGEYQFYKPFLNSILIAGSVGILSLTLGTPAAYAMSRYQFKGRKLFLFSVLATQMFSPIVLLVPLYKIVINLGLINTFTSVIVGRTAFALPMVIWLLLGYFENIPRGLEEAAMVDGCSLFKSLYRIILPLAGPGIATAGIYAFIMGWNDLMFSLTFINDASMSPITLAMSDFVGKNVVLWHEMMAAAVISILPVAILFSFVQRFLVQGLTAGAVKG